MMMRVQLATRDSIVSSKHVLSPVSLDFCIRPLRPGRAAELRPGFAVGGRVRRFAALRGGRRGEDGGRRP